MVFTRTATASALLAVLATSAHAANLDLTYEAPILSAVPLAPQAEPKPRFPVKSLAPVTVENSCTGPECTYETDISLPREEQTVRRISIGIQ